MRTDKDKATSLRSSGKSYNEISRELNIPKSTLATWFKNNQKSKRVRDLLTEKNRKESSERIKKLVRNNQERWHRWRESARQEAKEEFEFLKEDRLFVAGLSIYWSEGDNKPKNPTRIANADPRMIRLYLKFLTKSLKVKTEKIRLGLVLYPDLNIEKCKKFWLTITGLKVNQIYKPQIIKGRHPTSRLENGICLVILNGRYFKEKILVWIDLLSKTL